MEEDDKTFHQLFSRHDKYDDKVISKKDFKRACVKEMYMEDDDLFEKFVEFLINDEEEVSLPKLH